jgi:hypothetical protein
MELGNIQLAIVAGLVGTLAMDVMSVLATHVGLLAGPVKPSFIGRWGLSVLNGTFRHKNISQTKPFRFETLFGVLLHYSIGVTLALLYLALSSFFGFSISSIWAAIFFGVLTNIFPWFVLFPSYGFGFFGKSGKGLLFSSFFNHVVYGVGLSVVFWLGVVHSNMLPL